jgi:hypothetical protein
MKKVEFGEFGNGKAKTKGAVSTSDEYLLLSLYIDDMRFAEDITEHLGLLLDVKSGKKTFEQVAAPYGNIFPIGYNCGSLVFDKETAFFKSDDPEQYQDLQMPLQELTDLLKEWQSYLGA